MTQAEKKNRPAAANNRAARIPRDAQVHIQYIMRFEIWQGVIEIE